MPYIDYACEITKDSSSKEDVYVVSGKDVFTGTPVTIRIPGPAMFKYRQGAMIQDAFSMLNVDQREFLISGMYDSFPEEEEMEDGAIPQGTEDYSG